KDQCVMGDAAGSAQASGKEELNSRFYREYAARWREFLAACKVRPFRTLDDTGRRLGGLTDAGRSPLLGIVRFVAVNSRVEPPKPDVVKQPMEDVKRMFGAPQSKLAKGAEAVLRFPGAGTATLSRTELQAMLDPALLTIPPPFDHPVNTNDEAYVKALRDLG